MEFEQDVHDIFGLYPNVVNEAINLTLPNGAPLLDDKGQVTGFNAPNEFYGQFTHGIAALIDAELKNESVSRMALLARRKRLN